MFLNVVGQRLQGLPVRRTSYSLAPPQSLLIVLVMLLYMYNLEKMGRNLHVCTVHGKCNQILCQVNLRLTLNYFLLDFFLIIICLPVASIKCSVASVQKEKKNMNWKKILLFQSLQLILMKLLQTQIVYHSNWALLFTHWCWQQSCGGCSDTLGLSERHPLQPTVHFVLWHRGRRAKDHGFFERGVAFIS